VVKVLFGEKNSAACEKWLAYEQFKRSLPPMPAKDYERALREYCEEHKI